MAVLAENDWDGDGVSGISVNVRNINWSSPPAPNNSSSDGGVGTRSVPLGTIAVTASTMAEFGLTVGGPAKRMSGTVSVPQASLYPEEAIDGIIGMMKMPEWAEAALGAVNKMVAHNLAQKTAWVEVTMWAASPSRIHVTWNEHLNEARYSSLVTEMDLIGQQVVLGSSTLIGRPGVHNQPTGAGLSLDLTHFKSIVHGLRGNDELRGGVGNDLINGETGIDTFNVSTQRNSDSYVLFKVDDVAVVADRNSREFDIAAVERLKFDHDQIVTTASLRDFDPLEYIATYGDLIKGFGSDQGAGLGHYARYGWREGRFDGFQGDQYLASNTDLIRAWGAFGDAPNEDTAAGHYVRSGYFEGRGFGFNPWAYGARNPDLGRAGLDTYQELAHHYVEYGFWEGRLIA